jgi:repressor LexA
LLDGGARRKRTVAVPIIGTIAAGQPIPVPTPDTWSQVDYDNVFEATEEMTKGRDKVFALKVRGTSMIDALVNDGDIVILEQTSSCDDGDMVAAWLKRENEATLKKFYREGDRVRLQPANSTMKPIFTEPDNVEVQGKVLATIGRRD